MAGEKVLLKKKHLGSCLGTQDKYPLELANEVTPTYNAIRE